MSIADCAKKWKIPLVKIQQLCEDNEITGAAMLGGAWIIPADAEMPVPVIESRLSKPVAPENEMQKAALRHIEEGVPFDVTKYEIKGADAKAAGTAYLPSPLLLVSF